MTVEEPTEAAQTINIVHAPSESFQLELQETAGRVQRIQPLNSVEVTSISTDFPNSLNLFTQALNRLRVGDKIVLDINLEGKGLFQFMAYEVDDHGRLVSVSVSPVIEGRPQRQINIQINEIDGFGLVDQSRQLINFKTTK